MKDKIAQIQQELKELSKKNAGVSFWATQINRKIKKPVKVNFNYKNEYIKKRKLELQAELKGILTARDEIRKMIDEKLDFLNFELGDIDMRWRNGITIEKTSRDFAIIKAKEKIKLLEELKEKI